MNDVQSADYAVRIDSACSALGVVLLPHQREWIEAIMRGERPIWTHGRRSGRTVALRVAEYLNTPASTKEADRG